MVLQRMDKKEYSQHWAIESAHIESQGIYKILSEIAPSENTLEIGCGNGLATRHLALNRKVISFDNNKHLIKQINKNLKTLNAKPTIIQANLFDLNNEHVELVKQFSPKVIVGWFIGSDADDIDKYSDSNLPIMEKPKKYRENIEDLIVSNKLCLQTVEWIHLVNRSGVLQDVDEEVVEAAMDDYNTHVFSQNGFEVIEVKIIDWDRNGSDFLYAKANNPNLGQGRVVPKVISILARRCDS